MAGSLHRVVLGESISDAAGSHRGDGQGGWSHISGVEAFDISTASRWEGDASPCVCMLAVGRTG